jgi:hypothetical protein
VLGLEESPVFLEWLAEPSAGEVSGGNKKVKMTAHKTRFSITQRELLNNLMGCLALLGSIVRPLQVQAMEWWSIAKHQIPSTRSQGFRCSAGGGSGTRFQVSGVRCQVSGVRKKKHRS